MLERLGVIHDAVQAGTLVLERVCIDPPAGAIELELAVRDAQVAEQLPELRRGVAQYFLETLRHVVLRPRYAVPLTLEQYLRIHWLDVCYDLQCASRGMLNYLEPCRWEVRDAAVFVQVANAGIVRKLRELKCAEIIAASILRDIGQACRIELQAGDFSAEISANLQRRQEQVAAEVRVQQQQAVAERQRIVFDSSRVAPREPTEIKRIHAEKPLNKSVTIRGSVVSYRAAEGDAFFERCTLTDYSSSIECFLRVAGSRYSGNGNAAPKKPALQLLVGEWLLLSGVVDRPREDLELRIERIERIERPLRKDTAVTHRVELHAHTKMSQMDGLTALDELVARAAHWQHPAIGITDHGNVHAFPEAHALAKKHGVKVLLGSEAYLANHLSTEIEQVLARKEKSGRGMSRDEVGEFKSAVHHIIIYARTPQGLRNLYELISLAHCKYYYIKPMIPRDVLLQYREGLLIGSACECGELYRLVLHAHLHRITPAEFEQQFGAAQALYDYFEIQPRANNMFYVAKGTLASEEDILAINRRICELGAQYGKPVVATGDIHVLDPHELLLRRVLQIGQGYDKESDESGDTPLYFKTTDEMLDEFAYLGAAMAHTVVIDNPRRLAASVEEIAPIPSGFHPPKLEGAEDDLRQMCEARCRALYGAQPHPLVTRRMQRELADIVKNHFADLYMLAHKVVKKSLEDGYFVGSRGSVGSSFGSYTEFTQFDACGEPRPAPLDGILAEVGEDLPPRICPQCGAQMERYGFDIPFETFVGFEGNKTPDIDLNFASEYQSRAHRYIEDLFGKDHVYRAGTISTLQDRMAFGFVQKYLEKTGEQWPQAEVNRVIEGLVGIKRTTGQHPGGMIILPQHKSITEFCPVQYPANNTDSANQTTHFDYHAMEDQLLKLDILGHDDPTQIRMLSEYTGMDITKVPLNDAKTLSLFSGVKALGVSEKAIGSRVGTYGIPEFGTDFVRGMLDDTRPQTFADIVRISGLSHGTDVWLNNARDIIKNGHATLQQCICTRDDIMHYLIEKGLAPFSAFKIMEQVRKGKGLKPDDITAMRAQK
ncbi:MAG: PHP domain-containing protein, partial [bacterium]|nr:PHP domain-containing protein [bacterium]